MAADAGFANDRRGNAFRMAGYDGFANGRPKMSPSMAGCDGFARLNRSRVLPALRKSGTGCHLSASAACKTVFPCHREAEIDVPICKSVTSCHFKRQKLTNQKKLPHRRCDAGAFNHMPPAKTAGRNTYASPARPQVAGALLATLVDAARGHVADRLEHDDEHDAQKHREHHDVGLEALIAVADGDVAQTACADRAGHGRVPE